MIVTPTDLLSAQRELDLLRRKNELESRFGLLAYAPHPKQDAFHRAGRFKRRFVRTGNRFGKSTMGAAEDCAWALGYRPWYEEGDEARYEGIPQKSNSILILVTDWDKAQEIFTNEVRGEKQGKLFKLLPADSIERVVKNQSGKISEVHVKSKWGGTSTICLDTIQSYKSNPMGQESSDWDAIHVDEPIPENMWKANSRGLVDRNGSAWFTCTPLTEMWINDMFQPEGDKRVNSDGTKVTRRIVSEGEINIEVEFWMCIGSMHDNPTLSDEAKARFISELTPDERETRITGKPAHLTGTIYKTFVREHWSKGGHLFTGRDCERMGWRSPNHPPDSYTCRVAIDTHPSNPHAVLMGATAPSGHTYFWREIYQQCAPKHLARMTMHALDGTEGDPEEEYVVLRMPMRVLLEQAAYNKTPFDGMTIADEMIQAGLPMVEPAVKDLTFGILKVNQELQRRDKSGHPWLLFSEDLYETLREFDRYVWDPKTGKPRDAEDHMMENLYRLVLTGLHYVDPQKYEINITSHVPVPVGLRDLSLPNGEHKPKPNAGRYLKGAHFPLGQPVRRTVSSRSKYLYSSDN